MEGADSSRAPAEMAPTFLLWRQESGLRAGNPRIKQPTKQGLVSPTYRAVEQARALCVDRDNHLRGDAHGKRTNDWKAAH
jgi:hypothetical protein